MAALMKQCGKVRVLEKIDGSCGQVKRAQGVCHRCIVFLHASEIFPRKDFVAELLGQIDNPPPADTSKIRLVYQFLLSTLKHIALRL